MPPDNRDELLRVIKGLLDDIFSDSGPSPESRFTGFTIVAGPGGIPAVIRMFPGDRRGISWEVMEGEGNVYITAQLPAGIYSGPSVSFRPLAVQISFVGEICVVKLPSRIDVRGCSRHLKNGVLDIICEKA
jgi:hypothetical protein